MPTLYKILLVTILCHFGQARFTLNLVQTGQKHYIECRIKQKEWSKRTMRTLAVPCQRHIIATRDPSCVWSMWTTCSRTTSIISCQQSASQKCKNVVHTQLPSAGFWSRSRFLAVSLQVTSVVNQAVGCHYFPPGPQSPSQSLRGLLQISLQF